jgi:uncharacterized protein
MDLNLWIVLFAIGFIGSMISGMVGIGGSIIKYPMLLYLPPLFGFVAYTAQEVSAISAIQVFFATIAGVWAHRKSGLIHQKLVLSMGIPILIAGWIGGYGSSWLDDRTINLTYAILALVAAVMMLLPKTQVESTVAQDVQVNVKLAAGFAVAIGLVSGIVGAAGAFITVPIMLVVLRIPTRIAIASSLLITFIASIGTTAGKMMGGHLLWEPSIIMIIASLLAAPVGVWLSHMIKTRSLQWVLTGIIGATVVKIWTDLLSSMHFFSA